MRILIYGFGPYRQFPHNVTEEIVSAFPERRDVKKIVFPVRFYKGQFTRVLQTFKPDVVLGLGQCSTGTLLRPEHRAVNRRQNSGAETTKLIVRGGAPTLFTSLHLKLAKHAKSSQDAGRYVCNFSMYVMLDYIKRRELPILYGFVHVPHDYDPRKAVTLLHHAIFKAR
jgi:pyroglutamyl-peptidase